MMPRPTRLLQLAALLVLLSSALPAGSRAQVPSPAQIQQLLSQMSPEQIALQLQASGLSREQVRDRLRRAGYDPFLADQYFDALEQGQTGLAQAQDLDMSSGFLEALQGIGVFQGGAGVDTATGFALQPTRTPIPDSLFGQDTEPDTVPRVFGLNTFRAVSTNFEPLASGPAGPDYVLGPGDELSLVLTGDVELAYSLQVNREGAVFIPDVGQVSVNGLTLSQLEDRLYDRLGSVYSGVTRGADASTRFSLSLGRLRTIQVRVTGAVIRPGAYVVSAAATAIEALYQAGGPRAEGSFRRIQLRRGGAPARVIDLYPYLTTGAAEEDPRLEHGDVIFVPPAEDQVTIRGMVRRRAIFEMEEGEGLAALIHFAGGLLPDARTDRVQVDRILPPGDRSPGVDRVLLDAPLQEVLRGAESFELRGGDEVQVFAVLDRQRQRVSVQGAVWRPGSYELRPGTTVSSLVERAGGLTEDALTTQVLLRRRDLATGETSATRLTLEGGDPGPLLQEFDEVRVFALNSLMVPDSVAIFGRVRNPGSYPLSEGLTAGDLVLLAGGFIRGAAPWLAEVVRPERPDATDRNLSNSRYVALRDELPYPDEEFAGLRPDTVATLLDEGAFPLRNGDEVYIRTLPGYVSPQRVAVEGEVLSPGPYQLIRQDERFSSIMARSGGLTAAAFAEGVRLVRDSIPVGVDYEEAMANPGTEDDPVLRSGDRIVVPVLDNTVSVRGAVVFESRAVWREGLSLDDFVDQAGGYAQNADKGRVSVEYANGSRATVNKFLFFRSTPDVRPGSVIFVPEEPQGSGFNWDAALTRVLAVTTAVATVIVATR
ncbi:MAG TPA: SLBB domain-containing protein [Longimicrobiales bacterium]|nr:SLBB domain-containing protein [Longimicrobiales bacterium]